MTTDKKKQKKHSPTPRLLEWEFEEGPPRRSLRWWITVLLIGTGSSGLILLLDSSAIDGALSMFLWVGLVCAIALIPTVRRTAQLDGDLLYIWTNNGHRLRLERNLRDFASVRLQTFVGDRLNPDRHWLILQRRDGHGLTQVRLPDGDRLVEQILERVLYVVPPAHEVAPTLVDRFFTFADRWIGWWR